MSDQASGGLPTIGGLPIIQLTNSEILQGAVAGILRQCNAIQSDLKNARTTTDQMAWQINVEGCLGEMAFAKWLGAYWAGASTRKFHDGDVAKFEVRTTDNKNGRLFVYPNNPDERFFWLVRGCIGKYEIAGFKLGSECKNKDFWEEELQTPCFAVPAGKLSRPEVWSSV